MSGEGVNPYVGLRPFESGDSLYFFGRREQTAELLELLHRTRFLAVVGSSGCGKSSLIRAGLVPALLGGFLVEERDRWRIAVAKPGDEPLGNLAGALAAAFSDGEAPAGVGQAAEGGVALRQAMTEGHTGAVVDYLAPRLGRDTSLLLLVDQFEEVFAFRGLEDDARLAELSPQQRRDRAVRRGVAADFVDLLLGLGEQPGLSVYTVLTLRTDFLGECDLFFGLPEALNRGRYLVPRLGREQLRQAIEAPALLSGAGLAPRLLDHLLNELGDRSDRLPVLQHALQRTWEAWRGDGGGAIDHEHYRAAGTLAEALSRHAEEAIREEDLGATKALFQRLTDTDASLRRVRRPATLSELAAVTGLDREGVEAILERFRGGGRYFVVLSAGSSPDDPRVDLSHESLIRQWERLLRWVDEERESRDEFIELVRGARREAAGRAALLRDPELRIALDWRRAVRPTAAWVERYSRSGDAFEVAMGYLERSEAAARAAARRRVRVRNLLIGATAAVLATLSGLTVWALRSRSDAQRQEATAGATTDFLVRMFEVSDPGEARGNTITARELLDRGEERIGRELAGQPEARAQLMHTMGRVYQELGLYDQAAPLLEKALRMRETLFGDHDLDVAESRRHLAWLYSQQGKYAQAEPLVRSALEIREEALGPDHNEVAVTLNFLARLLAVQGKGDEAEPLFRRAVVIWEKTAGPEDPELAAVLLNLANLLRDQGKYAEAEPLYRQALTIWETALGPDHPNFATGLQSLARLYYPQGKYAEVEPLYRKALAIKVKALGPDHPGVASSLNDLAQLYSTQGKFAEAEPLYRQALAINEKALGLDHHEVAVQLNNLAGLLRNQGKYAAAEPLYQRALAIDEKALGPDHPELAAGLYGLARLYRDQGKYAEAEPVYQRSLAISEKALGPDHPLVAAGLYGLAGLYQDQGEYADAETAYRRSLDISETALGPDHPDVGRFLHGLGSLYQAQGRYAEAEPLYRRALAIRENALGENHPLVAETLESLAQLCRLTDREEEAAELEARARGIRERHAAAEKAVVP